MNNIYSNKTFMKNSLLRRLNPQKTPDLVTYTEDILTSFFVQCPEETPLTKPDVFFQEF